MHASSHTSDRQDNFESIEEFRGLALPKFTTHTELVRIQKEAIELKRAKKVGLAKDDGECPRAASGGRAGGARGTDAVETLDTQIGRATASSKRRTAWSATDRFRLMHARNMSHPRSGVEHTWGPQVCLSSNVDGSLKLFAYGPPPSFLSR